MIFFVKVSDISGYTIFENSYAKGQSEDLE